MNWCIACMPPVTMIILRSRAQLTTTLPRVPEMTRIDKWLWAARFFKTRTLATTAVDGGKVRLNGERVKPSRPVRLGDTLDIDNGATEWQVVVAGLSDVRSAASIAQTLYAETEASLAKREKTAEQRKYFHEPGAEIKGRPTKRDRRQLIKTRS
jgi:ribosome-associated heat shock protein Hsp15